MSPRFLTFSSLLLACFSAAGSVQAEPALLSSSAPTVSDAALPTVAASTAPYSKEAMLADLSQQLSERYRVTGELQIDLLRAWTPPAVKTGPVSLVILEAPTLLNSTLLVRLRLQTGTQTVAETSLLLRAQLMREVWMARNPTERGSTFDPAQFDIRSVDTLKERDTISIAEPTSDLTLARTVAPGRLLTWHDVARRALVRKGQVIEVSAVSGTLIVSMKALAMENGVAGDTVRLRNIESKKEFSAQVVADSRAEVRL